ncbi:Hypothetical predicted protein [Marmota monax]|uniref:Ionotropic glutamate receptor C-terminal domain-containing protein n=1 Tax=Marmota monax TaxID=9995 RepID=A0A5E4A3T3_MARMO|nr:hypothetical protein GHT09_000873 [Marmota monax]VTJ51382.1 Hypothetical predicted protein [Marmota monax]
MGQSVLVHLVGSHGDRRTPGDWLLHMDGQEEASVTPWVALPSLAHLSPLLRFKQAVANRCAGKGSEQSGASEGTHVLCPGLSCDPAGSVFRDEFDLAILQLQENNRLEILKRKWWEGGKCPKEEDHRAKGLGMENIGGIFVVLICGLIVAIFMAMLEFLWTLRHSEATEVSVCQEMVTELRSIILCQDSIHPRRRRTGVPQPRPPIPEERRPRGTATLSNGKLCGAGEPDQLAQRLAQEAALVARGCTHIRVCPECRRFQGLRARPSPARSEESLEWEKTTNSSEPE